MSVTDMSEAPSKTGRGKKPKAESKAPAPEQQTSPGVEPEQTGEPMRLREEDRDADADTSSGLLGEIPPPPADDLEDGPRPDVVPEQLRDAGGDPGAAMRETEGAPIAGAVRHAPAAVFVAPNGTPDAVDAASTDALSMVIGSEVFMTNHDMDWCRDSYGMRHRFTRFYLADRILVDRFAGDNRAIRAEIAEKGEAIAEHARETGEVYGYLPLNYGAMPSREDLEAARAGKLVGYRAPDPVPGVSYYGAR